MGAGRIRIGRAFTVASVLLLVVAVAGVSFALTQRQDSALLAVPAIRPPAMAPTVRDASLSRAIELPASNVLSAGLDDATFDAGTCPGLSNCLIGGSIQTGAADTEAAMLSRHDGVWGSIQVLPGTHLQNAGGSAGVTAVSCTSWQHCLAAGYASTSAVRSRPFLDVRTDGRWARATFPWSLGRGVEAAHVTALACPKWGSCAVVVSTYSNNWPGISNERSFISTEKAGRWSAPVWFPGRFQAEKINCQTAENCVAAGVVHRQYVGGLAVTFVVRGGVIGRRVALQPQRSVHWYPYDVEALSCTSARCAAVVCAQTNGSGRYFLAQGSRTKWLPASLAPIDVGQCDQYTGVPNYVELHCEPASCTVQTAFGSKSVNTRPNWFVNAATLSRVVDGKWNILATYTAPPVQNGGQTNGESGVVTCSAVGDCVGVVTLSPNDGQQRVVGVAVESGGAWGSESLVSGLAGGQGAGRATVTALSCAAVTSCAAGGTYVDAAGVTQAFVADRTAKGWSAPLPLPKVVSLNAGRLATIVAVSCPAPGACEAVGTYADKRAFTQSFALALVGDHWSMPKLLPRSDAGPTGDPAAPPGARADSVTVQSLACSRPGVCTATGEFDSPYDGGSQPFATSLDHGRWSALWQVDGNANDLGASNVTPATDVACGTNGRCVQVSIDQTLYYNNSAPPVPVGVRSGTRTWVSQSLSGSGKLAKAQQIGFEAVACNPSGSYCEAAGEAVLANGSEAVVAAAETGGVWHRATIVPGVRRLVVGPGATQVQPTVNAISCPADGDCVLVGTETSSSSSVNVVFYDQLRGGRWQQPALVRVGSLAESSPTTTVQVSCVSPSVCAITTLASVGASVLPVLAWVNGTSVGAAYPINGVDRLTHPGTASLDALSCARDGWCTLGGSVVDSNFAVEPLVANLHAPTEVVGN